MFHLEAHCLKSLLQLNELLRQSKAVDGLALGHCNARGKKACLHVDANRRFYARTILILLQLFVQSGDLNLLQPNELRLLHDFYSDVHGQSILALDGRHLRDTHSPESTHACEF